MLVYTVVKERKHLIGIRVSACADGCGDSGIWESRVQLLALNSQETGFQSPTGILAFQACTPQVLAQSKSAPVLSTVRSICTVSPRLAETAYASRGVFHQ
jgi:hypothetical protein